MVKVIDNDLCPIVQELDVIETMKSINSTCIGRNSPFVSVISIIIATKDHFLLLISMIWGIKNILPFKLHL